MSLFVRSVHIRPRLARGIVSNPALNTNPAFRNPAIVPFGIDFVDNDLRKHLENGEVDIDELESVYYHQCQNDAEFNASKLPRSYDSKLWGFIYGERLMDAKHKLDTIRNDETFMTNHLSQTVKELTMRMNRFYPDFDYKSQIDALNNDVDNNNVAYNDSYNEAMAEMITNDASSFMAIFRNNSFIPDCENGDADYLSQNVEDELISNYQFKWDFNSNLTSNFTRYFDRISKIEQILSPTIDSLSSNLRRNFFHFLVSCFAQNELKHIEYIIDGIERSTDYVISEDFTQSSLLDELEIEIDPNKELRAILDKDRESQDKERTMLINKCLQIYEYVKYHSMTRLILSSLMTQHKSYFAAFLNDFNGAQNIDSFESLNNTVLDEMVSFQSIYYENGDDLANTFCNLMSRITNESRRDIDICRFQNTSFESPPCFIASMIESSLNSARSNNNILDEIKYLTLHKYVTKHSSEISGMQLIKFLMNPSRNGLNGEFLKNIAFHFSKSASEATEILFEQIADITDSNKAELISSVQTELENLKNICNQYNDSRNRLEESIKNITFNGVESINFDHVQSVYDPLSTYLAQFRYYNNR